MTYSNTTEKFDIAVNVMASDTGTLRTRIWKAYLIFHTLTEKDFSDELKPDWNYILSTLTKEDAIYDDEGEVAVESVPNTLQTTNIDDCIRIAERICNLDAKLHERECMPA